MKRLTYTSKLIFVVLALVSAGEIHAQNAASIAPDCGPFFFQLTAAGNVPSAQGYANVQAVGGFGAGACASWEIKYTSVGFTALSLAVQSAPSATATTPGAYVNYAGTVATGVNPNTSTTGATSTFTDGTASIPWIRVNLSGLMGAGTVIGVFYGFKSGAGGGGGGGGGGGCPGTTVTPCVIGVRNDAGTAQVISACNNNAAITETATTAIKIATGTVGTTIKICHINTSWDVSANASVVQGTGVNCATGRVTLDGPLQNTLALAFDYGPFSPLVTNTTNVDVCLTFSVAVTGGGAVIFAQN